jgi:hypothetical protein
VCERAVAGVRASRQFLQQEVDVALTSDPLAASGFSSRSLGSLSMLSPQAVQVVARGSENISQPSLKVPLEHRTMEPEDTT